MGLAQVRAGIDAQLVGQPPGCRAVRRECVRLATAEVERGHQPPDQALVEWVLPDELLQLGDGAGVLAEGDLGIDQVHPRGQPTGIEAGDQPQGRGALQVGQGRPTPQRERLREQSGRPVGVVQAERVVAGRRQALEVQDVHAVPRDVEQVAAGRGAQDRGFVGRLDGLAQPRDVDLDRVGGAGRRGVVPDRVDQPVGAHAGAGREGQHREQGPRAMATDRCRHVVHAGVQRAEQADGQPPCARSSHGATVRIRACGRQGSATVQPFVWALQQPSLIGREPGWTNRRQSEGR